MSKAHCKTPMLPEDFNGINETDLSVTNEDNKNLKETWNVEVKKRERTKQKCDKNQQSCSESGYKVKKNETYVCGPCSTQFKTLRSLMKHKCNLVTNDDINGHAGEKYSKDSEKQSDPDTDLDSNDTTEKVLDLEMETGNEDEVLNGCKGHAYKCSECHKEYMKEHCLAKHQIMVHGGVMPWKCTHCNKEFASSTKFKNHCKEHGIIKPFKCEKCESFFSTAEILRVHRRTHTGERPFACQTCGKRFKQSSNLQDHIRKHNNDRSFICGTCSKSFNLKGDLTKHLLLHTGERRFRCKLCSKAFPGVSNFNRHMLTHTGLKPFSCSFCQKSFVRKEKLVEHERIHTGEKPFKCHVCGRSFSDSGNFSNHKKAHEDSDMRKSKRFPKTSKASSVPAAEECSIEYVVDNENSNLLLPHVLSTASAHLQQQQHQPQPKIILALPNMVNCSVGHQASIEGTEKNQFVVQLQTLDEAGEVITAPVSLSLQKMPQEGMSQYYEYVTVSSASQTDGTLSFMSPTKFVSEHQIIEVGDGSVTSCNAVGSSSLITQFSDSLTVPEGSSGVLLTPTKLFTSPRPVSEGGPLKCDVSSYEGQDDAAKSEQDKISTATSETECLSSISSMMNSYSAEHYCTGNLTLNDLTKVDDTQHHTYVVYYEGEGEEHRKFAEILPATPTKSYPQEKNHSPHSLIAPHVLVTPEHGSLPGAIVDRARVKPRVLEL